jgi:hypothetical protein
VRLAFLLLTALVLPFAWISLRTAFDCDLRKIPGPILNRFTTWALKIKVLSGRRSHYIHALHQRFGTHINPSFTTTRSS